MRISLRSSSRTPGVARPQNREPRKGFVLVEVIVAMVLLAVAISSLAGLVWSVSKSGIRTTGDAYKNGVLMHEVNRLVGLPYDSVHVGTQSYSVTSLPYKHTRVVTVAEPVPNVKTVKIVITPVNATYKKDSVSFTRTKARTSKVLCVTCQ
jgi:prepilin-type N-terminal cleavage/methylation domain-containing protein